MSGPSGRHRWGKRRARWYSEALRHSDYADKVVGTIEPVVKGCSSLLDVGAGCGALCVPLARVFDQVVALDSSAAMLDELRETAVSAGIGNIRTETATWDDAEAGTGRFDVVLCANVPSVLNEPAKSVTCLERHAKRFVFLVLGTARNANKFYFSELWPLIHGTSSPEKQDYFAVYSVLYRMQILANVVLVEYHFDQPFRDIDEAVLFWKDHMKLNGSEKDDILREFLSGKLEPSGNRLWARVHKKSAVIWWPSSREQQE